MGSWLVVVVVVIGGGGGGGGGGEIQTDGAWLTKRRGKIPAAETQQYPQ